MLYKSAWVSEPRHILVRNLELREPLAYEVAVKIKACGICGTDVHFYNDLPSKVLTPLGHEVAGIVAAIGADVKNVHVGQNVVVQNNIACGACAACLNQKPASCANIQSYMNDQAGMGEYLMIPSTMVIPYEELDFSEAALAEPMTVALDLLREADVQMGDNVLVMGPGCIGLCCIAISRLRGARSVVMVGHNLKNVRGAYRKEIAIQLGADMVIDSEDPEWKENVRCTFPALFDRVIVTSHPKTLSDGIAMGGFNSRIVFDGIDFQNDVVCLHANEFHFSKKRLIASHAIPNWGFPYALDLLRQSPMLAASLITHRLDFDLLQEGFTIYDDPTIPVIKPMILIS